MDDDADKRRVTFTDYMSILSAYRIQQPDEIQFHCSRLPDSEDVWWSRLWKEIPLRIVFHDKSALTGQLRLTREQKQLCKLSAIKVLLDQGGIFIDWSVLVIKNLNPLRQHSVTLGKVLSLLFFISKSIGLQPGSLNIWWMLLFLFNWWFLSLIVIVYHHLLFSSVSVAHRDV